jgi:hypothetical protein
VTYYNEAKCMPLLERRNRQQRAARAREVVRAMEPHTGAQGLGRGERSERHLPPDGG